MHFPTALFFGLLIANATARPSERSPPGFVRSRLRSRLYQESYSTDYLTTTIEVGTPPQTLTVAVDTSSHELWILDVDYPNVQPGQQTYNATASNSSTPEESYQSNDGLHIVMSGELYDDQVSLFDQPAQTQSFGSAIEVEKRGTGDEILIPFDGILGLAWLLDDEQYEEHTSPIVNALKDADPREFTIWFNFTLSKPSEGLTQSQVTIGSKDPDHCQGDQAESASYVPLSLYDYQLSIVLQQFEFGDRFEVPATFASLDVGTPVMLFPPDTYQALYRKVQPDYDFARDILTVDCSKVSQIPKMVFKINDISFDLEAKYFVVDIGLDRGQCALAIGLSDLVYNRGPWVLGTPFNRKYCLTYSLERQTVLINQAKGQ